VNTKIVISVTAVASLAVGAASGYFFARHKFEEQLGYFAEELDEMQAAFEAKIEEIEGVQRQIPGTKEFASPQEAWAAYRNMEPLGKAEVTVTSDGLTVEVDEEAQLAIKNIFNGGEEELDEEAVQAEVAARSDKVPYILSADEYYENESEYEQKTLTYFAGDNILIDEEQVIVENVARLVGEANLKRFGYRSKDQNTVFVRNSRAKLEFEILRSQGTYKHEVLGLDETPVEKPRRR
jgi:hypothetical protein